MWVERAPDARYFGADAVRRAYQRLGENHYRLMTNNCEHFCAWCLYGESRSVQIERLTSIAQRGRRFVAKTLLCAGVKPFSADAAHLAV
jgi:hypothetical protein